jgi:hypothetical protein
MKKVLWRAFVSQQQSWVAIKDEQIPNYVTELVALQERLCSVEFVNLFVCVLLWVG